MNKKKYKITGLFVFFNLVVLFAISGHAHAEDSKLTYCIAHRGEHDLLVTENSFASMKEAINKQADGVEFDVRHTKDHVPIIMHDKTLLRTATDKQSGKCPLRKNISSLNWEEIKTNCKLKDGSEIPTLNEILVYLEKFNKLDLFTFIELKDSPHDKTADIIEKHFYDKKDGLRIISFKETYLDKISNRLKFLDEKNFLDLDLGSWGKSKRYGINVWIKSYNLRKRYFLKLLESKNTEIGVWTVNKEKSMLPLFGKVDFVTTDKISTCINARNLKH